MTRWSRKEKRAYRKGLRAIAARYRDDDRKLDRIAYHRWKRTQARAVLTETEKK